MTREEAIKQLKSLLAHCERMWSKDDSIFESDCEALKIALSALRPVTREQVEKVWRGEWIKYAGYTECSNCEHWYPSTEDEEEDDRTPFCPACGAPMTAEAVELVLKRLEKLYETE